MALTIKNHKINDEYTLENGYVRITGISFTTATNQVIYYLTIYETKEDRDLEKQQEGTISILKEEINKYLQDANLAIGKIIIPEDATDEVKAELELQKQTLINEMMANKVIAERYLSFLRVTYNENRFKNWPIIPNEEKARFANLLVVDRGYPADIFNKHVSLLEKEVHVAYTMELGGEKLDEFIFNADTTSLAYTELKNFNALKDSENI
jgi:ribosomal protein S13